MMILTILFYRSLTCITAFVTAPRQNGCSQVSVAMGVGGEWAVATAMVAEVYAKRSRPVIGSTFHASSVFGSSWPLLLLLCDQPSLPGGQHLETRFLMVSSRHFSRL